MDRPAKDHSAETVTLSTPHMRLYLGEYEIPHIEAVAVPGHPGQYNLILDERFALLCDEKDIVDLVPFLAQLIAVATGNSDFAEFAKRRTLRRLTPPPADNVMGKAQTWSRERGEAHDG